MIEVRGLTRYYGPKKAIDDLSFEIGSNEIVGFLGLNGAGKTTTLKILAGLLLPTSGAVSIEGQDLFDAPLEARSRIGFLPEVPPLYEEMRVCDYLRYLCELRGMSGPQVQEATDEAIARTNLGSVAAQVIGTLSFGFKKRVGIAQAILHRPKLVILDEPIGGLDPVQIVDMRQVIAGLRDRCTVLVSSHILSEVSQTCDRLLILEQGRIVGQGSEADLLRQTEQATCLALTLRGESAALEGLLKATPAVARFEVVRSEGELLQCRVDLTGDHREDLVRALVEAGFGVRRVDDAEAELEQIFLQLTGQELVGKGVA